MVNIISVASELGYLNVPENTLIEIRSVEKLSKREDSDHHNRKPGRIYGSSVTYGSRYP